MRHDRVERDPRPVFEEPPPPKTFKPIRGRVVARICPAHACYANRRTGKNQGPPTHHPTYAGLTCPSCGGPTAAIMSQG